MPAAINWFKDRFSTQGVVETNSADKWQIAQTDIFHLYQCKRRLLMSAYRLYFVSTATPRPGKGGEAAKWWREKGQAVFETLPGVKSLQVFASQFGLGRRHNIEFWYEIDDYAVMDKWDDDIAADAAKWGPIFDEFDQLFEGGPSRLMGSWPESRLIE